MVKKLVFDAQESEGEVESIDLVLNGVTYPVYRPTTGQTALMMAAFAEDATAPDGAAAIINFYKNVMEEDGQAAIKALLSNPDIDDSLEQVINLTEQVIEAFTGNPTKQPADYLPSQKTGGRNSTASRQRPPSTRSRSPQPGSATGSTASSSPGATRRTRGTSSTES